MDLNIDLREKLKELPRDIGDIALLMLREIESGRKSNTQIEDMVLDEIRELLAEEGY